MTNRNCLTCNDCNDCELNIYMTDEQKATNDICDCWRYPLDYSLKPCPFCGNPAQIIDDDPYSWSPNEPVKAIRCSDEFGCPGYRIRVRFFATSKSDEEDARRLWNTRKRKNKAMWRGQQ